MSARRLIFSPLRRQNLYTHRPVFPLRSFKTSARSLDAAPAAATSPPPPPPRSGTFGRFIKGFFKYLVLPTTGFAVSYLVTCKFLYFSDPDSAAQLTADYDDTHIPTAIEIATESAFDRLDLVQELRANPVYEETRPHRDIPALVREHSLSTGVLHADDKIPASSLVFVNRAKLESVAVFKVGKNLCGHPGIVHGGLLATILDEGLCNTGFYALPSNIGVTARLKLDYRAPAYADQILVLKARVTKHEGRKVWVEGHIETVPAKSGQKPQVLVESEAMVVEPKWAGMLTRIVDIKS
ncbi:HotDog domain-containing protein [Myxozyma melibiosi]|uniref:HotDog domain-containing protein n=1 Tax=Myxozyma melibiosi TaxID=54550 RepID=A0ABR1F761_9ASCO